MGSSEWLAVLSAVIAAAVTIITTLLSYRTNERKSLSDDQQQLTKSLIEALKDCQDRLERMEQERNEARKN